MFMLKGSAKCKNRCLSEVSFKGNLPKNLIISEVPSREKQDEFLQSSLASTWQAE